MILKDINQIGINFRELFLITLGRNYLNIYRVLLAILQLGTCIAYIIFFTEACILIVENFDENMDENLIRLIAMLLTLPIIIPMQMISTYDFFYKWSIFGNFFSLFTIVFFSLFNLVTINSPKNLNYFKIQELPSFIGLSIFSIECVGAVWNVRNSLA